MAIKDEIFDLFQQVIQEHDGNASAAAAAMGMSPATLSAWLSGTRGRGYNVLFKVLDSIGAHIYKGEMPRPKKETDNFARKNAELTYEVAKLQGRITELESLRELLIGHMLNSRQEKTDS